MENSDMIQIGPTQRFYRCVNFEIELPLFKDRVFITLFRDEFEGMNYVDFPHNPVIRFHYTTRLSEVIPKILALFGVSTVFGFAVGRSISVFVDGHEYKNSQLKDFDLENAADIKIVVRNRPTYGVLRDVRSLIYIKLELPYLPGTAIMTFFLDTIKSNIINIYPSNRLLSLLPNRFSNDSKAVSTDKIKEFVVSCLTAFEINCIGVLVYRDGCLCTEKNLETLDFEDVAASVEILVPPRITRGICLAHHDNLSCALQSR